MTMKTVKLASQISRQALPPRLGDGHAFVYLAMEAEVPRGASLGVGAQFAQIFLPRRAGDPAARQGASLSHRF